MTDLLVGFGLVFVIEGLLWALAPKLRFGFWSWPRSANEQQLRTGGAVAVAAGVFLIWMVRG